MGGRAGPGRDATYELLDLKSFDVPLLTSPTHPMQAKKSYDDERVQAWSSAVQAARQLANEFEAWPARPDPAQVQPLRAPRGRRAAAAYTVIPA